MSTPTVNATPGAHRLNLRVLRFRTDPQREQPAPLARALIDSGRLQEALELTTEALRHDPNDADLWLAQGIVLSRRGELEAAQHALMQAARTAAADWAEPWRELAEVLLRRGRPEHALAVAERGASIDPEDERLDTIRRSALLSVRVLRFTHALEVDIEPVLLAEELLACGRVDEAFEVTRTALMSKFDDVDLLVTHARAARARGDREETLIALSTASFEAPNRPDVWRQLAEVHFELGENSYALACAARALALDPADAELFALHARLVSQSSAAAGGEDHDQFLNALTRAAPARRAS